uniref:DUF4806 domain-containing protein n=1 Tax=Salarias fasciatus TaxID=181472 RepID=A0A672GHG3_SALFA
MFYIVEFYGTREVEVVPAAWVADGVCQWPVYHNPEELVKAVKYAEQPGSSWEEFRVRILYTAANYTTARLKLPQVETHTDLQPAGGDDHKPERKQERLVLTNQELIMEQLRIITRTLNQIQGPPAGGQEVLEKDVFPLKDISSLLAVEQRVREEADFKHVIGGVDIKDTVWRIMKNVFSNSLAKQLNWRGVNGKTAFHSLQLKDIITGTVRNNQLTATATDQEVEAFIKRWLHLAGDRDGGRREREEKRRATQLTRKSEIRHSSNYCFR